MKPGSKTALITGIGGQDGSYLAELLLDRGYAVHGLVRRSSGLNRERIDGLRATGRMSDCVCTEASPFEPVSPYAIAKQYARAMTAFYRRGYGLHASNGILFNHEPPRRGFNFVTRKITATLARIAHGADELLLLGSLDSRRDWGYAPDYVRAMWLMTTHDAADDYVIATGETRSVREFVERAAAVAGFEIAWEGSGPAEAGYDRATGRRIVAVEPRFFRPLNHSSICGSAAKARAVLGWEPTVGFDRLVEIMMEADLGQA